MPRYLIQQKNPASHYIYFDLVIENINADKLQLQLPAWRPGRYELGNFAKNIKRLDVFNASGEIIPFTKLTKDLWEINTQGINSLKVTYSYYAAELNAGSCYADTDQVYINPVHCCFQISGKENEEHILELKLPDNYQIVSSLKKNNNCLIAESFEELVDSPLMASANIQSEKYTVNDIDFYLDFNGICSPDFEQMKKDFISFTKKTIEFWGDMPVKEYRFLFQILTNKFYHGVEHQNCTVIAIGPGYAINSGKTYEDILGVSCHELFHTWNVKFIRPAEMYPYNYTQENYAKTGYVYEGFTTYYGDKLLYSSQVFNTEQYFETLQERLFKHFHNFGRYNLSVADSSWETWLDGYVPGAPYRKTNIYDEGSLIALMLDVQILKATQNKKSLRDVCVALYNDIAKNKKGYTETDIISYANKISGTDLNDFFKKFVYNSTDYEEGLLTAFEYLGIEFRKEQNPALCEHAYGFKIIEVTNSAKVSLVAPYSPAWKCGLFAGDEIIAINGIVLKNNLNNWLSYFENKVEVELLVNSGDKIKNLKLSKDKKGNSWFFIPKLTITSTATASQKDNFKAWIHF
ncbi:MAG: M61 family peptidase [Sphingobacteriaceae bacterium]|nr:M61 family peptidase [Sphingobacteriaceae bacterium]